MDELEKIIEDEYKKIFSESFEVEMNDFKKMEVFFHEVAHPMDEGDSELWYLSLNVKNRGELPVVNEADETTEVSAISCMYKATYPDIYVLTDDYEAIDECKKDDCIGIITRSEAWASPTAVDRGIRPSAADDRVTIKLTTMTTPLGVHIISRFPDGKLESESIPKDQVYKKNMKLASALIDACFTW